MSFVTNGGSYEWIITQFESPDTITYGLSHFSSGSMEDAVFEKLSVGNVISRQLDLTLWNPTGFDPGTEFKLALRKYQGERKPENLIETLPKGTLHCDTYEISPYSDYADLVAYDALLKADIPFMQTGTWAATTDYAIVSSIASSMGVSIEANTDAYLSANPLTFNETPNIGDNGTTMREMLSVVGSMRGGNWIINDEGELTLVLLSGPLFSPQVITVDSNGLYQVEDVIDLTSSSILLEVKSDGLFYPIVKTSVIDATELVSIDADGIYTSDTWADLKSVIPQPIVKTIGNEVSKFDVSPTETIKGVEVWSGVSERYRAWDTDDYATWDDIDGAILYAQMPLMASQDVADRLWGMYEDFQYIPYEAQGVYTDPELPLGTVLEIKDNTVANGNPVILTKRTQNVDLLAACDLSADVTKQAVSYYPYLSPVERSLQTDIEGNRSSITANEDAITAEVTRAQGAEAELSSSITQTAESFEIALNDYKTEQSSYIRYQGGVVEIGGSDNDIVSKFKNDKWAVVGTNGQDATWVDENSLNGNDIISHNTIQNIANTGKWVVRTPNDRYQIKWVAN